MPSSVLVGIDLGTTVLKAAAFDERSGRVLVQADERLPIRTADDGTREQEPRRVLRAFRRVLTKIRNVLGHRWKHIAGMGLAAQGGSSLIIDRESGHTYTPLVLWNDNRARGHLGRVAAMKPPAYWRSLGRREGPGMGLGRMLWLKEKRPDLFKDANIYCGAGEFLYFLLTGTWRQDAGNALQMGCYKVSSRDIDPTPLGLLGIPLSFVSPMRKGHETHPISHAASKHFDLAEGIPVAGPYLDHEGGFLSAVGTCKRPLQCSLGTAWVGNFILPDGRKGNSPFQLVLPSPVGSGDLIVQPLLTGNVSWDWGLDKFVDRNHGKALSKLESIFDAGLLPAYGLVCLPWFARPNPLIPEAFGGGTFLGISPATGPHDLLRALASGMSFEMARVFSKVGSSGMVDGVVLGGGASKGSFFLKLLSALFAPLPVFVVEDEGISGARGALFTFSKKASQAKMRRVPKVSAELRCRIARGFDLYLEVFHRIYGTSTLGRHFHLLKGRHK